MLSRRHFLQRSSLVAFTQLVPGFLPQLAWAAKVDHDARVLVVIQLDGGNDGLNTVVPYADDAYARARPTLKLPADRLFRVNEQLALHSSMRAANDLLQDGRLAIVQGVGYPNPDRSHFGSMAVWHTARFTPDGQRGSGWIGAALDQVRRPAGAGGADAVYVGADDVPRALLGRRSVAAALARGDDLELRLALSREQAERGGGDGDLASFVRKRVLESVGTARDLADAARETKQATTYPESLLGRQLSLISRLIKAGGGTRVYYVTQNGYDTHGEQLIMHAELLGDFSRSLKAFLDDLRDDRLEDRVLVLAFSEFGRRVAENSSAGTDHGTAGPVFLAGPAVRAGLHGEAPKLTDLVDGDLKMSLDFRRVYATILDQWLQVPAREALAGAFEPLPLLLRAAAPRRG